MFELRTHFYVIIWKRHFVISIMIPHFLYFIIFDSSSAVLNIPDYDEEISMRGFLPSFHELSPRDEANMTQKLNDNIKGANLTTLLRLIRWTTGLQEELVELQKNYTEKGYKTFHGMPLEGSSTEVKASIDDAINFLKSYEGKIEHELREPSKIWNYPAKND